MSHLQVPKSSQLKEFGHHNLKFRLAIVGHRRMGFLDHETVLNPQLGRDRAEDQRRHDGYEALHAVLGLRGWRAARLGGSHVLSVLSWVGWLMGRLLILLYWATRTTTTGISLWGTSLLVIGEALRSIAFTYDYYLETLPSWLFYVSIWGILLLPEVLQLRAILPTSLEKQGDTWTVADIPRTARERRSARLDIGPFYLAVLWVTLTAASYMVYGWPMRVLRASQDHFMRKQFEYPYLGEEVFSRMSLLPIAQATVTAGQIAQLVMNFRSKTFAGNYALTCACKVAALGGMAAPFVAGKAYHEGLYLGAVAQGFLVLAEAAQAAWYPRVEQEVEDDDVEL